MADRPNRPMRPRGGPGGPGRRRRVVIDSGAARPPRDGRQARERQDSRPKERREVVHPTGPVTVESGVSVRDLSQALGIPAAQIIKVMMNLGKMVQITQSLSDDEVLVVAADDGVMPQTRESISHARAAEVPIVVAINKVDLPDANPDRARNELAQEGLQPEEWGGTTQFSEVSAKAKTGLDDLLEKVLLVADAELELTANPNAEASGPIIESRLDVGRGPVATMLVQRGTLRVGDAVVAGDAWGKVRALYTFRRDRAREARPGEPIEILGFDKPPPAGELCRVVENERQARHLANVRGERLRREQLAQQAKTGLSLETLFDQMQAGGVQDLNLVVKGDVDGSVEAAVSELQKIQHPEVRVNVIHTGVGAISEGDVSLAAV